MVLTSLLLEETFFHKASWVSPDGRRENQIDHFTISKKFRRSLQDVRVMRGTDIGSDHNLLVGKMKIKLKRYGSSFCKEGKRMRFQKTGQVPIQTEIGRRRWKWAGLDIH